MRLLVEYPEDRWERGHPDVIPSGGPERVTDEPPPPGWTQRRFLGFTRRIHEPLVWEGDNA